MEDNKRKLYDALSQDYDLGSFEQFSADIADETKRRKLYDATAEEYDYGDYDSFSKQLGFGVEPSRPTPGTEQVERVKQPARTVDHQAAAEGRAMFNQMAASRRGTSTLADAPQATKDYMNRPLSEKDKAMYAAKTENLLAGAEAARQNFNAAAEATEQRIRNPFPNQVGVDESSGKIVETSPRVNPYTGAVEKSFVTSWGGVYGSMDEAVLAQRASDSFQHEFAHFVNDTVDTTSLVDDTIREAKEAARNIRQSQAFLSGQGTAGMGGWATERLANEQMDSEKLSDALTEKIKGVLGEKENEIRSFAEKNGIKDVDAFVMQVQRAATEPAVMEIQQRLLDSAMPKSHAEYIVGGLVNSIAGMIASSNMNTANQRQYTAMAQEMTRNGKNPYFAPGFWDNVAKSGVTLIADTPIFGVAGKMGGAAVRGLYEANLARLMSGGLSLGAAERVVASALRSSFGARFAESAIAGTVSQGITLGAYNTLQSALSQYAYEGGVNFGEVAMSAGKGIATGAALGVFGGLSRAATYELSGLKKVAADVASFAGESAVFTATGRVFDGSDKSWAEDWAESVMTLGIMKATHLVPKYLANFKTAWNETKANYAKSESERQEHILSFTDNEKQELKNSVGGRNLMESLSKMEARESRYREDKSALTADQETLARNYESLMRDNNVSFATKQKVRYLLGGKIDKYAPLVEGYYVTHEPGAREWEVVSLDKDGRRIERQVFKNEADARKHAEKLNYSIQHDEQAAADVFFLEAAMAEMIRYGMEKEKILDALERYHAAGGDPSKLRAEDKTIITVLTAHMATLNSRDTRQVRTSPRDYDWEKLDDLRKTDPVAYEALLQASKEQVRKEEIGRVIQEQLGGKDFTFQDQTLPVKSVRIVTDAKGARYYVTNVEESTGALSVISVDGTVETKLFPDSIVSDESFTLDSFLSQRDEELHGSINSAYNQQYANPDINNAYDIAQAEAETRDLAIQAGADEGILDLDAYAIARYAQSIQVTNPERAAALLNYAIAKGANAGLVDGYNKETRAIMDEIERNLRENALVNGSLILATTADGTEVFITSKDVKVGNDGKLTTPTGVDGLVTYMDANGTIAQAKASTFAGATLQDLDTYLLIQEDELFNSRNSAFDSARATISHTGMSRSLESRIGQTLFVRDGAGVYEPIRIERMTNGGLTVVVSGDSRFLQGLATALGLQSPGGKQIEVSVDKLYPMLATNDDGSLATNQPEAEAAPEQAASETQQQQPSANAIDGRPIKDVHVNEEDGVVNFTYGDDPNGMLQEMDIDEFRQKTGQSETPAAPAEQPQTPAVEEAPAEETPAEEAPQSKIPVDKNGNKIYDAPGVEPIDAYEDMYSTEGLSEEDVDEWVISQSDEAEKNRNPKIKKGQSLADWGKEKAEANRKADFWKELREVAEEHAKDRKEQAQREAELQKEIEKYGVDTRGFDLTPQTVEEAVAEYLGNNEGIIDLDDAKKEIFGKSGRIPSELFRHAGNGGILTKKGGRKIADVANDIVGEFEGQLPITQDAVRDLIIDYLARYTKSEMREMIFNNRLNAALAELEQQNGASEEVVDDLPEAEESVEVQYNRKGRTLTAKYTIARDEDGFVHINSNGSSANMRPEEIGLTAEQMAGPKEEYNDEAQWKDVVDTINEVGVRVSEAVIRPDGTVEVTDTSNGLPPFSDAISKKIAAKFFPSLFTQEQLADIEATEIPIPASEAVEEAPEVTAVPEVEEPVAEPAEEGAPTVEEQIEAAREDVDTNPTDAQKEAGNYKKGHIQIDGYDVTIENPKGSVRSGKDANGNEWSVTMNNDYGYIRGTEGVDGDHIDMFLSDHPGEGKVFVVDQVNEDGTFDEHKVMYGFNSEQEAREAYLANYSPGWKGLGNITEVSKEEFKKWIDSSHRKTKPFAEYSSVKTSETPENSVPSQEEERRNRLDELQKRVSIVQQHPANLRAAYESGDAERIASAEKAMSDFINFSDSILLLRETENVAKDRRKKADKGSAEYKLQDFILKAIKKRIGQLDKAAVKAFDDARAVYEDRFTAEKDALESAIAYFQGELETAQELLDNVPEGANELYVANLKNRISSAKRYLDALTQELNRFNEEEEKEPEVKNEPEAEVKEPENLADEIFKETEASLPEKYKGRLSVRESSTGDESQENFVQSYDLDGRPSGVTRIDLFDAKPTENPTWFAIDGSDVDAPREKQDRWEELAKIYQSEHSDIKMTVLDELGVGFRHIGDALSFVEWAREQESNHDKGKSVNREAKDGKIEDFGEKIGGARKDNYRAKIRDAVKLTAKDLSTLKDPDKILPRKKIISLMEEGAMSKEDGLTLLSLNMAVRSLSDTLGMKTLGLMKYRDLASAWEKGDSLKMEITDADIDFLIEQKSDRVKALPNIRERERTSLEVLFQRVYNDYRATYDALNYPAVNRALKSAYIRPGTADGRYWVVSSPSSYRGWPFSTMEQAVAKMEAEYPEIKKTEASSASSEKGSEDKIGNLLVVKDDLGYYRVKSRSIPGKIYLSKKFYSRKDAEQFLKDNAASLVDREQKMVDALLGSNIGMVQREGRDYRNGKDVTPDQMLETFGFRGVEFGNWVPQAERQEYLNKTYDAIMDFCDIVGISPKAFSLGGRLGLAFGARGHSRALAHYEPMKEVINLTRMKGAGSLAHEWFHALDNYLAKQKTGNTSDMATDTKNVVREEMAQAFRDFVGAMNQLDYSKRSRRAGDYWGEVWERAARLFESYVYNELANKSVVSPLLVRKDTLFDDVQSEDNSASSWPYPSIAENEQMKPFFDKLFDTIEEKVGEDGKVLLFREDPTAAHESGREFTPEERRISAAEREITKATLDRMSEELGIKINRVGRDKMPKGHKSDKGYYNPNTGEMTIFMDNVTDERDAIATVLHETVGHHGLRKLFGDRFNDAMARIYAALDQKGKTCVNGYIARHPNADNTRAVEEYLSHLAESGRFKNVVWQRIKEIFGKIVDALFGTKGFLLTDNELDYILRASYDNLKNPNWLNTVEGRAFDTLLKRQLGINETDPNKPTDPDGPGAGNLYRDGDTGTAAEGFDSDMKKGRFVRKMEFQDHVVPVRKAYEHIQKETGKKEIAEDEDYAMRQNQVSSRAFTELQIFKHRQFDPAMETVAEIIGKLLGIPKRKVGGIAMWLKGLVSGKPKNAEQRNAYKRISNYLYAVSGLERNAYKNAEIEQQKQDALEAAREEIKEHNRKVLADSKYTDEQKKAILDVNEKWLKDEEQKIEDQYEAMKRDWSGLTGLFNLPAAQWQDAEKKAQEMIDEFKLAVNDDAMLDELWNRLRACTDYNLEHAYKYGLLTREEFELLHGTASQPRMWEYYLPLRGFSEPTAEEEYSFANLVNTQADPVVKKMKGRVTQSADPIANILKIAEAEIVQGNNNWAKQALWRFVLNAGKNSLLTLAEPWYQKDPATGTWSLAQPADGESLEHFEEKMKKNKEMEPDNYKKGRNGLRLNLIMANKANRNAHAIHVKVSGIEKIIWVNGDPILAKAVNGNFGWNNKFVQMWRSVNRYLSQAATSWSIKFTDKNVWRDTQFSRIATMVDEGQAYLHLLEKNWWANSMYGAQMVPIVRFMTAPVIKLVRDWENGTLIKKDSSKLTERERMFVDFMTDGGATGYTVVQSMDDIKREVDRMIRNAGKGVGAFPLLGAYIKYASTLSEASELLARFSVYQTSRQMGRSRQRSAYDAKETSVNFNRRGMQSGEGVWGWISAAMGLCYLFINPAIQSLDKFARLHKSHPWRMGAVDAAFIMMGFTNSLLNAMLAGMADGGGDGDDDDDKMGPDWYWNIPEWVRRSNMIIGSPFKKLGKWGYLVIPIALEYKGFYALGEMLSSIVQGKYADRDVATIANDVVGLAAEMMPLNPIEGYTPGENIPQSIGRAVAPDIVAPWVNIATNRNFAGIPLRRENIYDKTEPRAYGFYASTPKVLTDMCIKISEKTATWPVHVDIASGELRELLKGYGSGIYNYLEGFGKIAFADDEHPRRWSDFPYLSGLTGYLEEDRRDSFSDNVIRKYKQNSDDVVTRIRAAAPNGLLNMDKVERELSGKEKEKLLQIKDPEIIIYKYGDFLSKEANAAKILLGEDYILGREYYNETQKQISGKVGKVAKNGSTRIVDKVTRPALKDLRKDWMDARKKYLDMPEGKTEEEQAAKEDAKKDVQKAYLEYCKAEQDIANKLLEEEYHNAQTKLKNGIPYERKKTLGEKAYELTNR